MLVYGHFWSLKTISRRSENYKFSRGRFFLFGPGRARREQPNAGLRFCVRAFVRSVSHVKVIVDSLFGLVWDISFHAAWGAVPLLLIICCTRLDYTKTPPRQTHTRLSRL